MIWIIVGQPVCLGQKVFEVSWADSPDSEVKEFRYFTQIEKAADAADSVSRYFLSEGFLEGFFIESFRGDTSSRVWNFGRRFSWESIKTNTDLDEYFSSLGKPGLQYPEPYIWIDRALTYAENHGLPFAKLRVDSLAVKDNLITGVLIFEPGPNITWDSLSIIGESKTTVRYLQQLSGIVPGGVFSQMALEKAAKSIRKSRYFTLVGDPKVTFQIRQARPIFTIQDRRGNVFDGVIGFLPNENEPGKVLVTGEVDLALFHLGGKGRDFSLNWQRLNIQSQSLDIKAKESFVFGSPMDVSFGFSLLKQDSSFVNRSFELDFGYRISGGGYLSFFTRRQAGDLISSSDLPLDQSFPKAVDFRWNQYGIGLDLDWLDSPISPRRGTRLLSTFSLGNKRILQNIGLPVEVYDGLEMSSPQFQGYLSVEKHIFFRPSWGMWIRGVGGGIQNQNLFLNELSRTGGLKSIRGFNEKNFFAKNYAFLNLEQRLFFGQNSFLMVFADMGILQNPFSTPEIDRPVSFGTGINLDTDDGLFSFVFAIGKSDAQPLSISSSRIHFGYLARF